MTLIREKSDQFVYTKLGEKLGLEAVHQFMGKTIPVCVLTGNTIDVVGVPVDLNTENLLPSNMAYISKTYMTGDPLSFAMHFETIKADKLEVTLFGPHFYMRKMSEMAKDLLTKLESEMDVGGNTSDLLYSAWDALMYNGLKGIHKLRVSDGNTDAYIEAPLAQTYLMQKLKNRMNNVATLMR